MSEADSPHQYQDLTILLRPLFGKEYWFMKFTVDDGSRRQFFLTFGRSAGDIEVTTILFYRDQNCNLMNGRRKIRSRKISSSVLDESNVFLVT
jgi:hypothetical protein